MPPDIPAWLQVNRSRPCLICGRPNREHRSTYCTMSNDGAVAICGFVAEGCVKQTDTGRFIHRLKESDEWKPDDVRRTRGDEWPAANPLIETLAEQWRHDFTDGGRDRLSNHLGISAQSLVRMRVGVAAQHELNMLQTACFTKYAWTFPMSVVNGRVQDVGMRLRSPRGAKKYSLRGGTNAFFVPTDLSGDGPILVPEGPTDTGVLLDLGFDAIGRPMAIFRRTHFIEKLLRGREVIVIGDNDQPDEQGRRAGETGARQFAIGIRKVAKRVRVMFPPREHKDIRDAIREERADMGTVVEWIESSRSQAT